MSTYRVFHNYGMEGWKPVEGVFANIYDAVLAREADLNNGGGESIIVEVIPVLEAYRRADIEVERRPQDRR